jgi:hypothetical protein
MIPVEVVDEAGGLVAIDLLVEDAIEEGVLHVELVHRPVAGACQGKHRANEHRVDQR